MLPDVPSIGSSVRTYVEAFAEGADKVSSEDPSLEIPTNSGTGSSPPGEAPSSVDCKM